MVDVDISSTSDDPRNDDVTSSPAHLQMIDDEDEELDVESPEMECSVTSCSVSGGSPNSSPLRSSPLNLSSILPMSDSPHSSSESSTVSNSSVNGSIAPSMDKKHICEECGKAFPYLSILESHKRCHTGEKPFNCHFCDKKFAQKATLQVHERTHTGERPYKCKYCEKTFAQYGTKTVHEKSAHLGIRNYKCPKCDKCLSSPSALYTHKKTHGEKTFLCEFCPKTFTLKNYLKLHVKQVHEQNERKHVCRFCTKSFAYAGSLQVHVRTHTGERPYSCRFCPKAFASQGNLQSHERTHTGERPYTCGSCGRSFIQKSQLTAHEATHSLPSSAVPPEAERKACDYSCKFCGKRYAYASSLYVHIRLHTGERPFRCQFCDKSFTNQGNMQVHQRVHTGERPYSCSACHKSYAQKVGLKIHLEQCQPYLSGRGLEQCQEYLSGRGLERDSESPLNVDTDSDCSDGTKTRSDGTRDFQPLHNIYQNPSPPSAFSSLPSFPSLSTDLGLKMAGPIGFLPINNNNNNNNNSGQELQAPPPDYGPLAASSACFPQEPSVPEAMTSAFSAPLKADSAHLVDTTLLLRNIIESGLGASLFNQQLPSFPHQLLSTQLLLQHLHSAELAALLAPPPPLGPAPFSLLPAPQPIQPSALLGSLFPLGGLPPQYDLQPARS